MTVYRISACYGPCPPADWRDQLAKRLGGRPRRIGRWAELGLHGALECLAAGGASTLAATAALVVSSRHGPAVALTEASAQAREGLPLPLTFLQIQPSQLLATLSAQLHWCGDARFITQPDPLAVLDMALAGAEQHPDGLLIGWVDEMGGGSSVSDHSVWLRLEPVADPGGTWCALSEFETVVDGASHVRQSPSGLAVIIAPKVLSAV